MGLLHLLYVILYSIIVISLLISYDLFVKIFKKLHLRYSFKIIIGLILFVSQMYFIITFSINNVGHVYYEYTLPLFILYFNSFKMKNYFLLLALMMVFIGLS